MEFYILLFMVYELFIGHVFRLPHTIQPPTGNSTATASAMTNIFTVLATHLSSPTALLPSSTATGVGPWIREGAGQSHVVGYEISLWYILVPLVVLALLFVRRRRTPGTQPVPPAQLSLASSTVIADIAPTAQAPATNVLALKAQIEELSAALYQAQLDKNDLVTIKRRADERWQQTISEILESSNQVVPGQGMSSFYKNQAETRRQETVVAKTAQKLAIEQRDIAFAEKTTAEQALAQSKQQWTAKLESIEAEKTSLAQQVESSKEAQESMRRCLAKRSLEKQVLKEQEVRNSRKIVALELEVEQEKRRAAQGVTMLEKQLTNAKSNADLEITRLQNRLLAAQEQQSSSLPRGRADGAGAVSSSEFDEVYIPKRMCISTSTPQQNVEPEVAEAAMNPVGAQQQEKAEIEAPDAVEEETPAAQEAAPTASDASTEEPHVGDEVESKSSEQTTEKVPEEAEDHIPPPVEVPQIPSSPVQEQAQVDNPAVSALAQRDVEQQQHGDDIIAPVRTASDAPEEESLAVVEEEPPAAQEAALDASDAVKERPHVKDEPKSAPPEQAFETVSREVETYIPPPGKAILLPSGPLPEQAQVNAAPVSTPIQRDADGQPGDGGQPAPTQNVPHRRNLKGVQKQPRRGAKPGGYQPYQIKTPRGWSSTASHIPILNQQATQHADQSADSDMSEAPAPPEPSQTDRQGAAKVHYQLPQQQPQNNQPATTLLQFQLPQQQPQSNQTGAAASQGQPSQTPVAPESNIQYEPPPQWLLELVEEVDLGSATPNQPAQSISHSQGLTLATDDAQSSAYAQPNTIAGFDTDYVAASQHALNQAIGGPYHGTAHKAQPADQEDIAMNEQTLANAVTPFVGNSLLQAQPQQNLPYYDLPTYYSDSASSRAYGAPGDHYDYASTRYNQNTHESSPYHPPPDGYFTPAPDAHLSGAHAPTNQRNIPAGPSGSGTVNGMVHNQLAPDQGDISIHGQTLNRNVGSSAGPFAGLGGNDQSNLDPRLFQNGPYDSNPPSLKVSASLQHYDEDDVDYGDGNTNQGITTPPGDRVERDLQRDQLDKNPGSLDLDGDNEHQKPLEDPPPPSPEGMAGPKQHGDANITSSDTGNEELSKVDRDMFNSVHSYNDSDYENDDPKPASGQYSAKAQHQRRKDKAKAQELRPDGFARPAPNAYASPAPSAFTTPRSNGIRTPTPRVHNAPSGFPNYGNSNVTDGYVLSSTPTDSFNSRSPAPAGTPNTQPANRESGTLPLGVNKLTKNRGTTFEMLMRSVEEPKDESTTKSSKSYLGNLDLSKLTKRKDGGPRPFPSTVPNLPPSEFELMRKDPNRYCQVHDQLLKSGKCAKCIATPPPAAVPTGTKRSAQEDKLAGKAHHESLYADPYYFCLKHGKVPVAKEKGWCDQCSESENLDEVVVITEHPPEKKKLDRPKMPMPWGRMGGTKYQDLVVPEVPQMIQPAKSEEEVKAEIRKIREESERKAREEKKQKKKRGGG